MKTVNLKMRALNSGWAVVVVTLIACTFFSNEGTSQIQQAWVARYNNGITNGTHQAVKMALDSAGNTYITGFSQNANSNLGYVTIKYAPNGNQLWASRFDSTNYPSATPAALILDKSNNTVVTGNALTMKYDANGTQLWTAPFAGTSVAVDTNLNAYVVGFDTNFGTVKLSPAGSNLWQATSPSSLGPNVSELVAVDINGNVDVAGSQVEDCYGYGCYYQMLLAQYDANGHQIWAEGNTQQNYDAVQVEGIVLDNAANIYVLANFYFSPYTTIKYAANGSGVWTAGNPTYNLGSVSHGLVVDSANNVYVTGQKHDNFDANSAYGTYKINTNGAWVWTNAYPFIPVQPSAATSIAVDQSANVYVTGYSPGTNSANDIVTIKYDQNGNQIWLQRYNGPGNGNDAGNAIAVDNNGNVYVTGYSANASGGTDIVTIKYSPLSLQRRADGTVLLQAQGSPGESFDIQASADLQSWLDLGSVTADSNGLMQFDDTNASNYNARFYYTSPQ
jgi:hypothetical protein